MSLFIVALRIPQFQNSVSPVYVYLPHTLRAVPLQDPPICQRVVYCALSQVRNGFRAWNILLCREDGGKFPRIWTPQSYIYERRIAVLQHRRDLFSKNVLDNCLHHTRPGSVQLRGMAPRYSPFIHQFWHSPEVLRIISTIAGVELVPAMDYEINHTNVQLGPGGLEAVRNTPVDPPEATEGAIKSFEAEKSKGKPITDQSKPIIEWHRDSHPWVCVVMLSDARHMTGGETELMKGDGTTIKVKAPRMGCAVLLQGRYITHTAAPVTNMPERVTIVTSFRPKNPLLVDDTTNANVRNKSHLTELYYQWTTYRLEVIAQRARSALEALQVRYAKNVAESDPEGKVGLCKVETVSQEEIQNWCAGMIKYLQDTTHEMRPVGK